MKKFGWTGLCLCACVLASFLCACSGGSGGSDDRSVSSVRAMVSVGNFASTDSNGFLLDYKGETYYQTRNGAQFAHRIRPFSIAKYEVTYELWYTVRVWAESHGYTFAHLGAESEFDDAGAAPSEDGKFRPVVYISWRDAMIWCNAYSQMQGKTPCYYGDAGFTDVLRSVTNSSVNTANVPGSQDAPYVRWDANGYRLPTEGEWQYAASCGGRYPYNYASGATTYYDDLNDANGNGIIDGKEMSDLVAVYDQYWDGSTWAVKGENTTSSPVGSKAANAFGLYDMSGNILEQCFDWYSNLPASETENYSGPATGTGRVARGGCFDGYSVWCQVSYRELRGRPELADRNSGLRVVNSN